MRVTAAFLIAVLAIGSGAFAADHAKAKPTISGQYVEVRTCDVYTGPCFANGEVNLLGMEAILTWIVDEGTWKGVSLDGLKVVAVVRANATLGDQDRSPYPAKAVLIVDEKADTAQREALSDMAQTLGGRLIEDVVRTDTAKIETQLNDCTKESCATVKAGDLVEVNARCLVEGDKICHNERAFYPPLTDVKAMPHFAVVNSFTGEGLGITWSDSGGRSAYIGSFQR